MWHMRYVSRKYRKQQLLGERQDGARVGKNPWSHHYNGAAENGDAGASEASVSQRKDRGDSGESPDDQKYRGQVDAHAGGSEFLHEVEVRSSCGVSTLHTVPRAKINGAAMDSHRGRREKIGGESSGQTGKIRRQGKLPIDTAAAVGPTKDNN